MPSLSKQQHITDTKTLDWQHLIFLNLCFMGLFYVPSKAKRLPFFECLTVLNAPLDNVNKSVPNLCFIGLFAVVGEATINHSMPVRAVEKWQLEPHPWHWPLTLTSKQIEGQHTTAFAPHEGIVWWSDGRTDGRYQTYYHSCFEVDNYSRLYILRWLLLS